jgi:hypothetical protein
LLAKALFLETGLMKAFLYPNFFAGKGPRPYTMTSPYKDILTRKGNKTQVLEKFSAIFLLHP